MASQTSGVRRWGHVAVPAQIAKLGLHSQPPGICRFRTTEESETQRTRSWIATGLCLRASALDSSAQRYEIRDGNRCQPHIADSPHSNEGKIVVATENGAMQNQVPNGVTCFLTDGQNENQSSRVTWPSLVVRIIPLRQTYSHRQTSTLAEATFFAGESSVARAVGA